MPDYLYVIGERYDFSQDVDKQTNYLKIGVANNPKERLKQLQTANPRVLELMGARPIRSKESREAYEASVHSIFSEYRVAGEWFHWRNEIIIDWMPLNMLTNVEESLSMSPEDYFYELGKQVTAELYQNPTINTLHDSLRNTLKALIQSLGGESSQLTVLEPPASVFDQLGRGRATISF